MATNDNQTLDLFNSLMHRLGVKDTLKEIYDEEDAKIDVLKGEIFLREKPKIGIIGKIRAGKSTLGNAIFGEKAFKAGKALELTQEVSSTTLPSGIVIYDTPGFEGFSDYEMKTRELMSECDLLLHVIRYPGALDKGAVRFFEEDIKPLGKPVVTVVNVNEGEPFEGWEAIFKKAIEKLKLPNMVYVYAEKDTHAHAHAGFILKYVENLVIKMIDNLPEKYLVVFQDALTKQLQRSTKQYSVYHQSINAAAVAACTSIDADFSDKAIRAKQNKILLLTCGLILKVASIYESDFQVGTNVKKSTIDLMEARYEKITVEVPDGLTATIGATISGTLAAVVSQTPAIISLLAGVGLVISGPVGLIVSAIVAGGFGGLVLSRTKRTYQTHRKPQLGGFDITVAILSCGYTSLATISAQLDGKIAPQDNLQFFSKAYQEAYDNTIRNALYTYKEQLEHATAGDRVKILTLLSDNADLHQIFML